MKRLKIFYYTISGLFLVLTIGFLATGTFGFMTLSNIQGTIAEQEYRYQVISERQSILESLDKKYTTLTPDIDLINTALPSDKESSKLIADIDTLSKNSGLKLTQVQSATSGKKATVEDPSLLQTVKGNYGYEIPLEIKVEGGFTNFTGFVKQLENYQRLLNITSFEITKPTGEEEISDNIEAKLKITAYLKK